jgi:hypothetical protein
MAAPLTMLDRAAYHFGRGIPVEDEDVFESAPHWRDRVPVASPDEAR